MADPGKRTDVADATRIAELLARPCRVCQRAINKLSPKALYCSQQCLDWQKKHPGEPIPLVGRQCKLCGASLDGRRLEVRFCSLLCQRRGLNGTPHFEPTARCEHCGDEFPRTHGLQRFCSDACRDVPYRERWERENRERIREARREYNRRTGVGTAATHRYHARRRKQATEIFPNVEIFDRDGWICQICEQSVDPGLRHPHPLSASLDHVVPVSKGGEHSRSNTQLAHLCCNLFKSDGEVASAVATERARRAADAWMASARLDDGVPRAV